MFRDELQEFEEGMSAMRERRRFMRYKVTDVVEYTKVSGHTRVSSKATIKNIGLGGLCATSSRILETGDELIIELPLPYNANISTLARVVWTKPSEDTGGSICGVKFLTVSSQPLLMGYIAYARKMSDAA